jgi:ABC-2 type transport system permease protein
MYGAARIYRAGVLMYGKRPTIVELARWLRYS